MNNIDRLGDLIAGQIKKTIAGNASIITELGQIKANNALQVSSLKNYIPKGQYMVTRTARENGLSAGDRVIVIWVGNEPIVIDVVSSS